MSSRVDEYVRSLEEVMSAAQCYFTCTRIPASPDDLEMCRDNLWKALEAARETRRKHDPT